MHPVTSGGRAFGFTLVLYAGDNFSYFIASILVGLDARQGASEAAHKDDVRLDQEEIEALRDAS